MITFDSLINYFDSLIDNSYPMTPYEVAINIIKPNAYEKMILGVISNEQLQIIRQKYNY